MIHLDTNYLIGLLIKNSRQAVDVNRWLFESQSLAASAIAWSEFLNGPVASLEVEQTEDVLQSRIIPFTKSEAALAADLFNKAGRRRGSGFDCMIAAAAILGNAELATMNQSDFKLFVPYGLKLVNALV